MMMMMMIVQLSEVKPVHFCSQNVHPYFIGEMYRQIDGMVTFKIIA